MMQLTKKNINHTKGSRPSVKVVSVLLALLICIYSIFYITHASVPVSNHQLQHNALIADDILQNQLKMESSLTDIKHLFAGLEENMSAGGSPQRELNAGQKKKKQRNHMDCDGFPSWPLPPKAILYDDAVGAPKCYHGKSSQAWVLHQSSAPNRRPSRAEVQATLLNLPPGTGYEWHSDSDICAFMRTQPLRFQALYNSLPRTPHKVDLWRYLFLYQRGGIYLDDDAQILAPFNSSFVDSIDSVYMTQGNSEKAMGTAADGENARNSPFGITIYNGFLISRPCNPVLLSVAERMVDIGPVGGIDTWEKDVANPNLMNWYNLKLLATAVAERAPEDFGGDASCREGPKKCLLYRGVHEKAMIFHGKPLIIYKDDHDWTTAVFDVPSSFNPVTQVRDDKRDATGIKDDPHPSPWTPDLKQ